MLNAVTEREGFPAAVLIRALEPVHGFGKSDPRPASGPGKLCKTLKIDKALNGVSLESRQLWIGKDGQSDKDLEIRWSPRIGVSVGQTNTGGKSVRQPVVSKQCQEDFALFQYNQRFKIVQMKKSSFVVLLLAVAAAHVFHYPRRREYNDYR